MHPLKNRSEHELVEAVTALHQRLTDANLTLKMHIMDNECPTKVKQHLRNEGIDLQLVPPNYHRLNPAERAIQTFKDHFVAGLSSCNPKFPLHLWDKLLPHAEKTLNMLRPCCIIPKISADTFMHGQHDYNKVPLAPPGTKVLIYEAPRVRKTWASHGVEGWYLGPAEDHYRCHRVYVTRTRATRICRTVEFFPHLSPMATLSPAG